MTSRLPRAARVAAPASLPPDGLRGLDTAFSRLIDVPEWPTGSAAQGASKGAPPGNASETAAFGAATVRTWHMLDNNDELTALGVTPVGTVLCVHGNPTWSYLWRRLVTAASNAAGAGQPAWRVIAVDQLELGFSERTGRPRPLARRVQDLADLTRTLGLTGPVIPLGHDWGGVVSLGWAVDHPELCAGLILLNTAVHQPQGWPIPALLRPALGLLGPATVSTPAFLEATLTLGHPALDRAIKEGYRAPYHGARRRGGIGGFVADIPVGARHPSRAELDRIAHGISTLPIPSLLLWGPRDPIFSDRYLNDLLDRLPQADVHRFEGAGHLLAEDADYASAVLTWLGDRHTGTPATRATAASVATSVLRDRSGSREPSPLWSHLDRLSDSSATALVELSPPSGGAPRVVSWRLLSRRVREIAAGLVSLGVQHGDRVSLLVPPGADLTAVLYACLRIGAVVVVADAGLGLRGLTRAVRSAWPDYVVGAVAGLTAARALGWPGQRISTVSLPGPVRAGLRVTHTLSELAALGRGAPALPIPPEPSDPAAVLFTSGSTGPAKGVVYRHGQLQAVRDTLAAHYGIGAGTGLVAGFAPFALLGPALGARTATPDMQVTAPGTLSAAALAAAVSAVAADVVFLSPAALANVVATADRLSAQERGALAGVRRFLSAGAPVSEPLLAAATSLMPGATAHTPYGMTEGLLLTDITLAEIQQAGDGDGPGGVCVGLPTGSTRVHISALDRDGAPTGEPSDLNGVTGEIVVSAPHLADHYDRLWLTDRHSKLGAPTAHRWHRTGDVGHLDSTGRLWVEGRVQHVITAPQRVLTPVGPERRIEAVRGIARAALVGIGPSGVQQLVAVVETTVPTRRVALAPAALCSAIRDALPVPVAAVLAVPRLPTDLRHNSKIDRVRLSRWAGAILAGGRMRQP